MAFGKRRGYSDCIRGVRARNVLDAHEFAAKINRPLNVAIDINWSRTSLHDDVYGAHFRHFRKAAGRFLRESGVDGLTCTWARERPTHPTPRPNAHMNCHCPLKTFDKLKRELHRFLPPGAVCLDAEAIYIQHIGPTEDDDLRRKEYLVKGAHPRAHLKIKKRRSSQGRIHGKRCGTSEDIGPAARLRFADAAAPPVPATKAPARPLAVGDDLPPVWPATR